MPTTDPWHYPRTELAKRTFALIEKRLANALVLFGPRRIGKTEFLIRDLGPLAEKAGHRVVYASFWQSPLSPVATLLTALHEGQQKRGLAGQLQRLAERPQPETQDRRQAGRRRRGGGRDRSRRPQGRAAERHAAADGSAAGQARAQDQAHRAHARRGAGAGGRGGEPPAGRRAAHQPRQAPRRARRRVHRLQPRRAVGDVLRQAGAVLPFRHLDRARAPRPALRRAPARRLPAGHGREARPRGRARRLRGPAQEPVLLPQAARAAAAARPSATSPAALERLRSGLAANLGYDRLWLSLNAIQRALAFTLARGVETPFARPIAPRSAA